MYDSDDVAYARQRLCDTIITHQGRAVLVENVCVNVAGGPLLIQAAALLHKDADGDYLRINDEIGAYSLVPVDLGYVNQNSYGRNYVSYFVRNPMREDWRQGLRRHNCCSIWGQGNWDLSSISKTIEGAYPTLDEALHFSENGDRDGLMAWCRDFCLDANKNIFYRSYGKVGNFIGEAKEFLLDQKFFWVEESLREVV